MPSRTVRIIAMLWLSVCLGCHQSNSLDLQAVSGAVTFDGKPLEQGSIQFVPQESTTGLLSGAQITAGQYRIPQDKGLPPGKYTVRVYSADQTTSVPSGPPGTESSMPAKERIPVRYNSQSQLAAEIMADGTNTFDFALTSVAKE